MMSEKELRARASDACELCTGTDGLSVYEVAPRDAGILVCGVCKEQLDHPEAVEPNHWRALNDSMWSEVPAVQVMAYRMLHRLRAESWPNDLLEMLYLDDDTKAWARAGLPDENAIVHTDGNGNVLENGDTVVLTKDLKVKGANFTAKRGTAVRNIRLVPDNAGQIEGRVETQQIVILTEYVKKK